MLIARVSCDNSRMGGRSRPLAGLLVAALRRRFKEFASLPDAGLWREAPVWQASGPSERHALSRLGLSPDARIPLPQVVQGHGFGGVLNIALRGDAVEMFHGDIDRFESAIAASLGPALGAMRAGRLRIETAGVEHLSTNSRSHYRIPSLLVDLDSRSNVDEVIVQRIGIAAANTAFGYEDRLDRLLAISGISDEIVIEGYGEPVLIESLRGRDLYSIPHVAFSISGRIYGPLFMGDRPGHERPGVAQLDAHTTALHDAEAW